MSVNWDEPGWYGTDQFLDSTWAMYGGKPSDPAEQARIGLRYMRERYGNGSWLMPGATWVVNDTGTSIRVLTEQQERDRANGTGGTGIASPNDAPDA